MRFHDLRHNCATLLLSRGVHPKFVQVQLGHATIAITLDTYSHVLPSMGDATPQRPWKTCSPECVDPSCHQMVVKEPELASGSLRALHVLPAKRRFFNVGLPGLEPGTSSLSGRRPIFRWLSLRPYTRPK
jgi:hypothetical protein